MSTRADCSIVDDIMSDRTDVRDVGQIDIDDGISWLRNRCARFHCKRAKRCFSALFSFLERNESQNQIGTVAEVGAISASVLGVIFGVMSSLFVALYAVYVKKVMD